MDRFERQSLDNYITGHYGEDQFRGEWECEFCHKVFFWSTEFDEHECPEAPDPLDDIPQTAQP